MTNVCEAGIESNGALSALVRVDAVMKESWLEGGVIDTSAACREGS